MIHAIASAVAAVGIGAAAAVAGVATQPAVAVAVPSSNPYVYTCPACGETWLRNEDGLRQLELHTDIMHPDRWAKITGDGS